MENTVTFYRVFWSRNRHKPKTHVWTVLGQNPAGDGIVNNCFDPGSRFIGSGVSSNTPYLIHAKNAQKELEQSCVTVDDIRFDVILMFMPRILWSVMARATDRNFSYLLGLSVFSHDNRGNFGGLTAAALGCNHLIKRAGEGGGCNLQRQSFPGTSLSMLYNLS